MRTSTIGSRDPHARLAKLKTGWITYPDPSRTTPTWARGTIQGRPVEMGTEIIVRRPPARTTADGRPRKADTLGHGSILRQQVERQERQQAERRIQQLARDRARQEAERQRREKAEQQAREQAERLVREQAREQVDREARERAEREAREQAVPRVRDREALRRWEQEQESRRRQEEEHRRQMREYYLRGGAEAFGIAGQYKTLEPPPRRPVERDAPITGTPLSPRLSSTPELDPSFEVSFRRAYSVLNAPGRIDPRGVPFIQLSAPMVGLSEVLKGFLPFPGVGLAEAIIGKDLLTGEELEAWERVLIFFADIASVMPTRVIARIPGQAARIAASSMAESRGLAAEWALVAQRAGVPPETMLRFTRRLAGMRLDRVRGLLLRVQNAKEAKQALQLTADDRQCLFEINKVIQEFHDPNPSRAKVVAPTARGFALAPRQEKVLGQMLGRPFGRATSVSVRPELKSTAEIADRLRERIRAHWDAALPTTGESADLAARRVYEDLVKVNPPNANKWVRTRLYNEWRRRAMRRIYHDESLRRDLLEHAGIVIVRDPKTNAVSMYVPTESKTGSVIRTPLEFDHHGLDEGHARAVQRAVESGDYHHLAITVDSTNLQLLTERENENVIEEIRKALLRMIGR